MHHECAFMGGPMASPNKSKVVESTRALSLGANTLPVVYTETVIQPTK